MKKIFLSFGVALFAMGCGGQSPSEDVDEAAKTLGQVPVDFPSKPRTPTTDAAGTVKYFGGPVIPNAKVYVVWWGDPSKLNPVITAAKGGIADFFAGVTNSNYMDWMNEYSTTINAQAGAHAGKAGTGQRIGRGNYAGTKTLTNIPSATSITDAQIQATLDQAFTLGTLPEPDENTIYAIYFPSSVSISLDGNGTSCFSFGAYHEALLEKTRHNAFYLVMPDCGYSFNGFTSVTSHELIEAVTDAIPTPGTNPDFPQAWNDSSGSETGDLCEGSSGTVSTALGNFKVQGIWDELSQGCKSFRSYAQDFNVGLAKNTGSLSKGKSASFTVQTATVAGKAQALTLSVSAPAGFSAHLAQTKLTSGQSTTLSVTGQTAVTAAQIVVRADGTTGKGGQSHTATLLVNVSGKEPDTSIAF